MNTGAWANSRWTLCGSSRIGKVVSGPAPLDSLAPKNGFLFIGELAKLTGTDPKTIRFYERAELISPPRHGRLRTYLASDVRRLKNILTLRRLGVPTAQIHGILDVLAPEDDVLASEKAVSLLKQHLDLLKNRQAELSQQIEKTSTALHGLVA